MSIQYMCKSVFLKSLKIPKNNQNKKGKTSRSLSSAPIHTKTSLAFASLMIDKTHHILYNRFLYTLYSYDNY